MTDQKNTEHLVKNLLAEQIGVEPEDINDSDNFMEDLHMTVVNITDFVESIPTQGFDISLIDFTQIETVEDLIDALDAQKPIE